MALWYHLDKCSRVRNNDAAERTPVGVGIFVPIAESVSGPDKQHFGSAKKQALK